MTLRRPHQRSNWRRRLTLGWGVLVKRVCLVDPQQRWDAGGPDVENPGVGYFAVDLHHHLKLFVLNDAVCIGEKRTGWL